MAFEQQIEGGQHLLILTQMGAGGDPDRPIRPQLLAQGTPFCLHLVTKLDIELDGAGHRQPRTIDAEVGEAVGVILMLTEQMGQRPAQGVEGAVEAGITLAGSLGEAGVDDGHRQVARLAGGQPVRPQLGLHHPERARLEGVEKGGNGPGVVERRVAMDHQIPQLGSLIGAGAGGGSEQDRQIGPLRLEGANKRRDGQRLPHAHRMDPERRILSGGGQPPEMLGPALAKTGLAFLRLVEGQQRQRQSQVDQQVVEQTVGHLTDSAPASCRHRPPAPAPGRSGT